MRQRKSISYLGNTTKVLILKFGKHPKDMKKKVNSMKEKATTTKEIEQITIEDTSYAENNITKI
jgi:hypothetical protein